MTVDFAILALGAILGVPQIWIGLSKSQPANLKLIAFLLGISGCAAAIGGLADLLGAPGIVRTGCLAAALVFFIAWLLMIVSLARHNTSM